MALSAAAFNGCSLNTEISIPEQPIPTSFQDQPDTTSIAVIDWRQYFNDALLIKLIDTAVSNNHDLHIALQRIESSRSSVKLANAAMLPQVSLNVGGGVRKFGLYTMDGAGNASTEIRPGQIVPENLPDIYLGLQSSWEIDVWGKLENQRKSPASLAYSLAGTLVAPIINMKSLEAAFNSAQANQLAAMYRYQKTILNAYVEVANQLSSIKSLQQISTLKKQQSEALKQSVESSNELYKAARASYLEVLIAQQSALQSNLELINVTKRQRMATITIYKALGGGWK